MSVWASLAGMALSGLEKGTEYKFQADQARAARQFSERMRNTQWQAAVADMEAAGLNPALAYSQGPNASPSGAMASGAGGTGAVSSALQAKRLESELKVMYEQSRKTAAEAGIAETGERYAVRRAEAEIEAMEAEAYRRRMIGDASAGIGSLSRYAADKAPEVFKLIEGVGGFLGESSARALNVRDRAFGAYTKPLDWAYELVRKLNNQRGDLWRQATSPLRGWFRRER